MIRSGVWTGKQFDLMQHDIQYILSQNHWNQQVIRLNNDYEVASDRQKEWRTLRMSMRMLFTLLQRYILEF